MKIPVQTTRVFRASSYSAHGLPVARGVAGVTPQVLRPSGCDYITCGVEAVACAAACASGVGALACIACLGSSYNDCKGCF